MKKISKITCFAIIVLFIPLSAILGQDKKNEQKIKVIVKDGSDTKVLIDTLIHGDNGPDSPTLKDGSVVYLRHPKGEGSHFFVTYSSGDKDGSGVTKEMTVISTDTADRAEDEQGNVMYYRNDRDGHHRYKVVSRSAGNGDDREEMVYVNRDWRDREDNDSDSNMEKTRFVIAKDGMVVTIEGTDEAKAKELAKEIKEKLGVTDKDDKKEVPGSKQQKKIK